MTNIYDLDTPTLLVDLDRLESNIRDMSLLAGQSGKKLRPHIKTHKTPEIARMQLAAGATGLTVAKLGEAETMAAAGFTDIFIANEIVGRQKIDRLLDLIQTAHVILGVDSVEVAEPIAQAAAARGVSVPVRIEIDTGHGRAGTTTLLEAVRLAIYITDRSGLELDGLFTHEGQTYTSGDQAERKQAVQNAAIQIGEIAKAIDDVGIPLREISMGSTPGARFLTDEPGVTEMRPGSYVFLDRMQVGKGARQDRCALTVLATVISVRPGGRVVIDAGTKSLASDRPMPDGDFGEIPDHPELMFVGASEEHGNLRITGECKLRVGDKVRVLPNHVCTCVNMHDSLTAFRNETVEAVWTIAARGKVR